MNKTYTSLLFLFLIDNVSFAQEINNKFKLIWADEFDYNGLPDSTKWDYESGCSIRNKEFQMYMVKDLDNSWVSDGILHIKAFTETINNCTISSASLITKGKFEFQYGIIKIKAKIPGTLGSWPALWMMGDKNIYGKWPLNGEIDLLENVGWDTNRVHINIHTVAFNHTKSSNKGVSITIPNLYQDFHIYGMDWNELRLVFYFDEKPVFTYENDKMNNPETWPYNHPFYILMNLAIGGTWGAEKGISPKCLPSTMEVDYVRIYQKK